MAKKQSVIALSGRNIFKNSKNQTIYYSKRKNIGYVIPESDFNQFRTMQNRYVLGAIVAIFLNIFADISYLISGIVGLIVILILEYHFRSKLLAKYTQFANFVPEKTKSTMDILADEDRNRLILKTVLWFALSVLLILNLFSLENKDNLIIGASVLFSIYAFYVGILQVRAIIKKGKK